MKKCVKCRTTIETAIPLSVASGGRRKSSCDFNGWSCDFSGWSCDFSNNMALVRGHVTSFGGHVILVVSYVTFSRLSCDFSS